MIDFVYANGCEIEEGDVIRWYVWDQDDYTTWTFTGVVKKGGVMYLGAGVDFGRGFGKMISFEKVVESSQNNDKVMRGIFKVGEVMDLVRLIKEVVNE